MKKNGLYIAANLNSSYFTSVTFTPHFAARLMKRKCVCCLFNDEWGLSGWIQTGKWESVTRRYWRLLWKLL